MTALVFEAATCSLRRWPSLQRLREELPILIAAVIAHSIPIVVRCLLRGLHRVVSADTSPSRGFLPRMCVIQFLMSSMAAAGTAWALTATTMASVSTSTSASGATVTEVKHLDPDHAFAILLSAVAAAVADTTRSFRRRETELRFPVIAVQYCYWEWR